MPDFFPKRNWITLFLACANSAGSLGAGSLEVNFQDYDCTRVPEPHALDWQHLFEAVLLFLEGSSGGRAFSADGLRYSALYSALQGLGVESSPARKLARQQCPFGFLCLCVIEAMSFASRNTEELEPKLSCVQDILKAFPVYAVAGSKWPVFKLLDQFSTLNKLDFSQKSDFKHMNRFVRRHYGEFVFSPNELSPFGAGHSVSWKSWLSLHPTVSIDSPRLEELAQASRLGFNAFGPALQALGAAVVESLQKDKKLETGGQPIIRISLAHGRAWARLMPFSWARWAAAGLRASVFIAMDEEAASVCQAYHLICVHSSAPSILHKYTLTALALHLGVDVMYCDLDTVPVGRSPLATWNSVSRNRPGYDLVVSTHNYNCLNAGLWFVKASNSTAAFTLLLLEYLYEHWYEGDQRAFNAFATGNLSVSYEKVARERFPSLSVAVLSPDLHAGKAGFPSAEQLETFHAYGIEGEAKLQLLDQLYGVGTLDQEAAEQRASLWAWAHDPAVQQQVRLRAMLSLATFEKPRLEEPCW